MWKNDLIKKLFSNDPADIDVEQAIYHKYCNIPNSLYKYRSFDKNEYWRDMLEEDLTVLSRPKDFNDLYDCAFSFSAEERGIEHFKRNLDELLSKLSSLHKFSSEEINILNKSENFFYLTLILQKEEPLVEGKNIKETSEILEKIILNQFRYSGSLFEERIRDNMFIYCFSETNKSIRMWSLYADDNKGYCIEYNFPELGVDHHLTRMIFPVIYSDTLFDSDNYINPGSVDKKFNNVLISFVDGMSHNDGINQPLFDFSQIENPYDKNYNNMVFCYAAINKSKEWEYEKEWRYVFPIGPITAEKVPIRFPKPKGIYLGAKVDEEYREEVLKIAEERNIKVYAMHRKPSEFGLEANVIYE